MRLPSKTNIMKIERKSFEIKAATLEDNCLKGAASVVGVLDRGRDVIFPGAWDKTLKGFLANGFVAVGHAWDELPVAMPVLAKATGNQLYTEAVFHSTAAAQDARTVCKERLAQNLSVGLSVGFMMNYGDEDNPAYLYFETGQKMLDFAKANGYDMSLFDAKGIKACKGYCRGILNIDELMEYSIVPVPCNQDAIASEAKSENHRSESPNLEASLTAATIKTERDFEAYLRDAGYGRKDATAITLHGFKSLDFKSLSAEAAVIEIPPVEENVENLQRDAEGTADSEREIVTPAVPIETETVPTEIPASPSEEEKSLEEAAQANRHALSVLSQRTLTLRMAALRSTF